MALDLQLKVINNVKGKADKFCQLIFRGKVVVVSCNKCNKLRFTLWIHSNLFLKLST